MSISSGAPGAVAGFAIGSLFGPASPITAPMGALIGFALSGGVTFGLAEYESVIQMADEQGISREESEPAAIISGLAEGGFEFASNLITGGILKVATPLTIPAREGLKTGIRQIFKMGLKETLIRGGAVLASETSMEMLTAGVQVEQYKKLVLEIQPFGKAQKKPWVRRLLHLLFLPVLEPVQQGCIKILSEEILKTLKSIRKNGCRPPKKWARY